jgi:Family of unknown function (DUF5906)
MPQHNYIFLSTMETWPAAGINARLGPHAVLENGKIKLDSEGEPVILPAAAWLDQCAPVEQMTWAPGEDRFIRGRLVTHGGWFEKPGTTCLNTYKPPTIEMGDATKAGPWLEHVHRIYPDYADEIIVRFAYKTQYPGEKINHGLVLGGSQGIGKDTLLEPVKHAVGSWNFRETSPRTLLGQFNPFVKSVILRVNELHDLGDANRFQLYELMKTLLAAPPDVLPVNNKYMQEQHVINCCFVVPTTNKKESLYLPREDRRHFVVWSNLEKEDFNNDYWNEIWSYYHRGGFGHVAAYLATLDVSAFDPKAPPPKTPVFWEIVGLNCAPEDAELADVIEALGNPVALTIEMMANKVSANGAKGSFYEYLTDRKNSRSIAYRLNECGYVQVRPSTRKDGFWRVNGRRQVVYARAELSIRDQFKAVEDLAKSYETARKGGAG